MHADAIHCIGSLPMNNKKPNLSAVLDVNRPQLCTCSSLYNCNAVLLFLSRTIWNFWSRFTNRVSPAHTTPFRRTKCCVEPRNLLRTTKIQNFRGVLSFFILSLSSRYYIAVRWGWRYWRNGAAPHRNERDVRKGTSISRRARVVSPKIPSNVYSTEQK